MSLCTFRALQPSFEAIFSAMAVGKHKMDLTIMFICNFYLALQYFVTHHLWSEIYKDYYEDENSIFRYEGDNISFEDIASSGNRDKIIVAILKSLKGKDDKIIEVTESRTSTE